jgi:cell wall-associated NlpC family hydrolase
VKPLRILRKTAVILLILSICVSALYITASAGTIAYGAATVDATSLNIRTGPDTTYPIVKTVPHDEKIVILEKTSAEWFHAVYSGVEGYVASLYLKDVVTAENFKATGKLTGDDVFLRSGPSTTSSLLGSCDAGAKVNIIGINNGWFKIVYDDATGYIRSDFVTLVADAPASAPPAEAAGTKSAADSQQSSTSSATSSESTSSTGSAPQPSAEELSLRQQVVSFALQYVGGSYVYGGTSPSVGFDCSGLVYYVFHHFDFNVTRTASSQFAHDGVTVAKADLLPGDLVFFSSNGGYSVTHVGIYIGNSQFVHASTPKVGIVISDLDSSYYTGVWYGAKRVLS